MVFKGDSQFQEGQTAYFLQVNGREVSNVGDTKGVRHDHKVLCVRERVCLGHKAYTRRMREKGGMRGGRDERREGGGMRGGRGEG